MLACAFLASAMAAVPPARADGLRISAFGDSVMLGASNAIVSSLAGNDVTVDAHEDVSLLGSLGTLQAARPTIGDVVVLDLGYNDGSDLTAWRDRIDQAMTILQGVPKVIWLDQHDWQAGRAEMNDELVAAMQRYPNLEVVDWNAVVVSHPEYVYGDGVHLTPPGQVAMGDLVRDRVAAFIEARIAATTTTEPPTTTAKPAAAAAGAPAKSQLRTGGSGSSAGGDDNGWIPVVIAGGALALVLALVLRRQWSRPPPRRG